MAIEEYREFILEVVEGEKAEGPQITSIICDTRYLRHPRLSDGSRGGVRIVEGIQEGTQMFPPPYLAGYSEFERTRRVWGFAGGSDTRVQSLSAGRAGSL